MGGCNSMCVPMKNPNLCRENHASLPKVRSSKRHISTAFNISGLITNPDSLNINTASEEELMTLPCINRATARNIVEYRQQIGGFKQVEDLALVSGVGATKLESLRSEICVSKGKSQQSKNNSPSASISGVDPNVVRKPTKTQPHKRININTSNVFQLMKVKGIGLIMAQNIVVYRDKKGPFKSIDDLLKVKGIGPAILSLVRHELSLDDLEDQQSNSADSGIGPAHPVVNPSIRSPDSTSTTSDHVNQLVAMCGPLTQSSNRPDVTPFNFSTDNRRVVRVASWNVQQLTDDKINNPGVKEVICMTILENGFGLVAFQEVAKKEALQKVCDELNNPTLPSVSKWRGAKGHWELHVSQTPTGRMFQGVEYNGFLYDTEQEISLLSASLIENSPDDGGEKAFVRKPFVGHFKLHTADIALCSVHLKATGLKNEDLEEAKTEATTVPRIAKAVMKKLKHEKDIVVLGDFNLSPDCEEFDALRTNGYTNMIPSNLYTNISTKNMSGSQAYDNIWASRQLQQIYTGNHGVVREGLTSPWIPDGWSWGGVVSDHCPIWAEYFVDKDCDAGISRELKGITLTSNPVGQ